MARCHVLGLVVLCFALFVAAASATQFRVGGQRGWSVPDANAEPYNVWAGRMRFKIGDQLLFVYPNDTDSVLVVDPAAYNSCNTSSALNKFDDGNTLFTFDRSGPFFFISGNDTNCRANEKLIVVVLGPHHSGTMLPPSSAPLPSPAGEPMPSPATTPTPAPASAPTTTPGSSPQTPSGSDSAPSDGGSKATTSSNQASGASTLVSGFVASLGAYIGYAMLAI